jgi:hypothetical protein
MTTAVNGGPPLAVASSQVLQTYRPTASVAREVSWIETASPVASSLGSDMGVMLAHARLPRRRLVPRHGMHVV